jgi:hypothetical protein
MTHIRPHGKISCRFQNEAIAEGDWQIEAHYPGAEIRYIKGLKSKAMSMSGFRDHAA